MAFPRLRGFKKKRSVSTLACFLQAVSGISVVIELKDYSIVQGILAHCDDAMNVEMKDATIHESKHHIMPFHCDSFYIQGKFIRFVHFDHYFNASKYSVLCWSRCTSAGRDVSGNGCLVVDCCTAFAILLNFSKISTMAYRRDNIRDESDVFRKIRNVFTSLNDKLEKDVREHLRAVYGTLALGLMAATVGTLLHFFVDFLHDNFFLFFGSILLMIALLKTPHTVHNERKRFGYFITFCVLSGVNSGSLVEKSVMVDPSTISTAFLSAAVVFGCFTMAALHAPSTKFLHLGGVITSGLLFIMVTTVFSHSAFVHNTCLWLAFVINCTMILYDTQLICEKRRRGDTDYILHTVELFIDFINLFRYILAFLSEKKEKMNRRRND
ncbi:unnamed protein product [Litomosoides sigmodontis]|uniref:Sm domain-containing protein n=1 Tax=Litomosoides sigmodontis TaxID=42156 RepID=A0A3P6UZ06_LITSI|nr:unnamed protein product [Litomosoides sigmodontis]